MSKRKIIGIALTAAFFIAAVVFGILFFKQYNDAKNSEETFEGLQVEIAAKVVEKEKNKDTLPPVDPEDEYAVAQQAMELYKDLKDQNEDFVGWISIDGTNINYPVVQNRDTPGFYLKHGFDKSYSDYGVPYLEEDCSIQYSNNLVVYGHHMNNGTMFADLVKYADENFYKEHKTITFDTLMGLGEYEVVAVFHFNTNYEDFRFNEYINMKEARFTEYMDNVHARQIYDTGVTAAYGDTLLTLSTCDYTYENGRFVLVAKKLA